MLLKINLINFQLQKEKSYGAESNGHEEGCICMILSFKHFFASKTKTAIIIFFFFSPSKELSWTKVLKSQALIISIFEHLKHNLIKSESYEIYSQ